MAKSKSKLAWKIGSGPADIEEPTQALVDLMKLAPAPKAPSGKEAAWPAANVEMRPVTSLVPYARNTRTHDDAQVSQIAASIKEWGWTTPVLVDEEGVLIAGHGRVLAAQRLGLDRVPVMIARGWTDAQKQAYRIADNKLALNAGWDDAMLRVEFGDLMEVGFDTKLVGFDDSELARLMSASDDSFHPDENDETEGAGKLYLRIGDERIPLTQAEYEGLCSQIEQYIEEFGVPFGFGSWLLDKCSDIARKE